MGSQNKNVVTTATKKVLKQDQEKDVAMEIEEAKQEPSLLMEATMPDSYANINTNIRFATKDKKVPEYDDSQMAQ